MISMRLNLGCGNRKLPGWLNVDKVAACSPDQVVDLESLPWPWPSDSVDEILLNHVLEHLGEAAETYLGIIKELYRVCRAGAQITIVVPHPRHDHFLHDPTHVRVVTEGGLLMFSQAANRHWMAAGGADTPLGLYLGVDLETVSVQRQLAEPWRGRFARGEIKNAELEQAAASYNNVIEQTQIVLRAVKSPGADNSAKSSAPAMQSS
jgi:hypothetical protein